MYLKKFCFFILVCNFDDYSNYLNEEYYHNLTNFGQDWTENKKKLDAS